jgi:hypothetical protein
MLIMLAPTVASLLLLSGMHTNDNRTISVCVNGEIYNHKALKKLILEKHPGKKFNTQSDCEVTAGRMPLLCRRRVLGSGAYARGCSDTQPPPLRCMPRSITPT